MEDRIYKFRAWVPGYEDDSKFYMYPVTKLETEKDSWDEYSIEIFDGYNYMSIEKSGVEVMQFTGLLDKSGKEIYEGDIVMIPREQRGGKVFWASEQDREQWDITGWMFENQWTGERFKDTVVIGNVWENPQLLTNNKGDNK